MELGQFLPKKKKESDVQIIVNEYLQAVGLAGLPKAYYQKHNISYPRMAKWAKELLFLNANNVSTSIHMIYEFNSKMKDMGLTWNLNTLNRWIREEKFW